MLPIRFSKLAVRFFSKTGVVFVKSVESVLSFSLVAEVLSCLSGSDLTVLVSFFVEDDCGFMLVSMLDWMGGLGKWGSVLTVDVTSDGSFGWTGWLEG